MQTSRNFVIQFDKLKVRLPTAGDCRNEDIAECEKMSLLACHGSDPKGCLLGTSENCAMVNPFPDRGNAKWG